MNKNTLLRFHSPLLFAMMLALLLPLLCACASGSGETSSVVSAHSQTPSQTESDNGDIRPEIIDLDGREINVYCWDWGATSASIQGYTGEILYSTDENATAVDTAKKAVIDTVESEYNCTISGTLENSTTFLQTVQNMVTSGTFSYDIIFQSSSFCASMVANDLLTDLNTVSTLHLENSWWDQNAVEQLSIGNRLFYVNGDINTYDDLGTWCVLFNKTLKENLGITEDFYQMVKDGTWTLDNFIELCQGITTDSNGDGTINEFDRWAFGTETYNIFVQVLGGGLHAVEKDDNDLPFFTVKNHATQTYSALDKIINFYNSGEVMVANGGKYSQYASPWEETTIKAFTEGRELFFMCGLINVAGFRSMEDEFGILPIPKTFADQDSYYHTVSAGNSSYMAIPYGVPNVEELGVVIEAIAMKSQEWVTPEFYDIQLKYRDARDDDSAEMLDLIFATRSFDLGPIYNWGNIMNCYYLLDTNYASRFQSLLDAAETAMQSTVEQIQGYTAY